MENNKKDMTRELLNIARNKQNNILKESDGDNDIIVITDDPKFGVQVLSNQIASFRQTVNPSAKFSTPDDNNKTGSPLVFFPKDGNLVFSGVITNMNDLKFQFSLNDLTNAPYIFCDGMALTEDNINTLNKLYGFYKNWQDEWFSATDLLDKLKKNK